MTHETPLKDEMNMEQLLDQAAPASQVGAVVTARVVEHTPQGVLVDVGLKAEGMIPIGEFRSLPQPPAVGQTFPALIKQMAGPEGHPLVSWREAVEKAGWLAALKAKESQEPMEGTVVRQVKGGLVVDMGVEAFLPASQIDRRPVRDVSAFVGKKIRAVVIEMDPRKGNVVVSRRRFLEKEASAKQEETLKTLETGKTVRGTVTGVANFGAFVDIGGVEGLLRTSDAAWGRLDKISDVLSVGDEIDVKVLRYDPATKKIALGRKQLLPHPWDAAGPKYAAGRVVKGKVTSLTAFGAFVELEPGVEGLIHQSEFSWKERWAKAKDFLKIGEEVEVKILSFQRAEEKIALSLKRVRENPWEEAAREYKPGARVKGTVTNLVPFGAFVRLSSGIEGLLRTADISWTKPVHHPKEWFTPGQEIEAVILEVNPAAERVSLGFKQLRQDPFTRYKIGQAVEGKVVRLTDFGAIVQLDDDVEGFVHVSEIPFPEGRAALAAEGRSFEKRLTHPSEALEVGQVVSAAVIKLHRSSKRIDLSIRKQEKKEERKLLKQYQAKNEGITLAEMTDWEQEKNTLTEG
jgi:small subunit ribosomal protein S1